MSQTLKQLLAKTLEDATLSRGETLALQAVLAKLNPTSAQREQLRQIAFELAEAAIGTPEAGKVLKWLSQVTQLLQVFPQATVAEAWFSPHNDCVRRIEQLFAQAQQQINICVFTITDNRLSSAILEAHRRGIAIRIISDNDKAFDRGSDIEQLQSRGVSVRVDFTEFHMHHKFAVFDRKILLTGSYNWTVGAARDNQENFVITSDSHLIQAYDNEFDRLWQKLG